MDLVASVRKEGSRGGRSEFKWSDVQTSQHRENYLGHSLMAPVGRWQQGRDLSWYTKADGDKSAADTAREEEIKRVKEAEQEAMARALGLPVAPKSANANLTPLGGKEVGNAVKEATGSGDDDKDELGGARGIGYGGFGGISGSGNQSDKLEAVGMERGTERVHRTSRRHHDDRQRTRGRSRDRERSLEKKSRRRYYDSLWNERRHRSRSRDRRREGRDKGQEKEREYRRRRSISRSRSRDRERRYRRTRHRSRSRSPDYRDSHREHRHYD